MNTPVAFCCLRGELIGCFGLTEPNHGSDPAHMETRVNLSFLIMLKKLEYSNSFLKDIQVEIFIKPL